ncbi:hypothetical protein N8563_00945 [bacterium]|nr:hypothetical protein [bacterium]
MNSKQIRKKVQFRVAQEEQGVTMVLALFMGLILMTGITGLMLRQITSRKLSSSESYQQMAENAAINGFNRILGEINKDDESRYKGYFLTLRNDAEGWGWRNPNSANFPLVELCTDTSLSITADPLSDSNDVANAISLSNTDPEVRSQREDGKSPIKLYYRLRGYALAGDGKGADEGTFQIEGIVKRAKDQNNDNSYLARALLTRSLYIDQRVAGSGDWAVLGGYYMRLGNTKIQGSGKILLDVSNPTPYQVSGDCQKLLEKVGATNIKLESRIWPVLDRGLPTTDLFSSESDPTAPDRTKDKMNSASSTIRVWSFDDSETPMNPRCNQTACVRGEDSDEFVVPEGINADAKTIIIEQDDICSGSTSFECHIYIEHMNLNESKVLIETGSQSSPRPVVIHLELPNRDSTRVDDISGNIVLGSNSKFCGINNGSTNCNQKPERFVISSAAGSDDLSCEATSHVLDFSGNSFPHAVVHLRKGTLRPSGNATLHGVIWAQNICTSDTQFTLETSESNKPVVEAMYELWGWRDKGFPGYGQMVVRGIRGTGLDTFRRW